MLWSSYNNFHHSVIGCHGYRYVICLTASFSNTLIFNQVTFLIKVWYTIKNRLTRWNTKSSLYNNLLLNLVSIHENVNKKFMNEWRRTIEMNRVSHVTGSTVFVFTIGYHMLGGELFPFSQYAGRQTLPYRITDEASHFTVMSHSWLKFFIAWPQHYRYHIVIGPQFCNWKVWYILFDS